MRIPRTKERKFGYESGVTDGLRYLPILLRVFEFSWFPWPVCPPPGFPGCFDGVAPNLGILRFDFYVFSSATACVLSRVFFCILSSSQDSMHCPLSLTVGLCTSCQMSKLQRHNRFFFRRVMTLGFHALPNTAFRSSRTKKTSSSVFRLIAAALTTLVFVQMCTSLLPSL